MADFYAATYGLGHHKTLTDFVEMINNEDPVVLTGLANAVHKRIKATYGSKDNLPQNYNSGGEVGISSTNKSPRENINKGKCDGVGYMSMFLKEWGATDQQIKEAKKKVENSNHKFNDYSWLTPDKLTDPNLDIKEVFKMMNDDIKHGANIKVSLETRNARDKK